jgi:Na+-transporting methylmalonyl-CoA/oxaloacetate decarboxylase gamma subunit
MKRVLPVIFFIVALCILGMFVALLSFIISRQYGVSKAGIARQAMKLVFAFYMAAQYLAQVSKTVKQISTLPAIVRLFFSELDKLQFAGLAVPSECQRLPAFTLERSLFIGMIICFVGLLFLVILLPGIGRLNAVFFSRVPTNNSPMTTTAEKPVEQSVSDTSFAEKAAKRDGFLTRVLLTLTSIVYALTVNLSFWVLSCDIKKLVKVKQYLALANDGSLLANHLSCTNASCLADPLYQEQLVPVSVATKYQYYVCGESAHGKIQPLAKTVLVVCAVFPLVCIGLVTYRLRVHFIEQYQRVPAGSVLSVPFGLLYKRLRGRKCCKRSASVLSGAFNDARGAQIPTSDLVDSLHSVRRDPYLAFFTGGEYRPSAFYFSSLLLAANFLLSLSFNVLSNNPSSRFALTFSVLLFMLLGILWTRPFGRTEQFGFVVQMSLLGVAMLVSLTDMVGRSKKSEGALRFLAYLDIVVIPLLPCALVIYFVHAIVSRSKMEKQCAKGIQCADVTSPVLHTKASHNPNPSQNMEGTFLSPSPISDVSEERAANHVRNDAQNPLFRKDPQESDPSGTKLSSRSVTTYRPKAIASYREKRPLPR